MSITVQRHTNGTKLKENYTTVQTVMPFTVKEDVSRTFKNFIKYRQINSKDAAISAILAAITLFSEDSSTFWAIKSTLVEIDDSETKTHTNIGVPNTISSKVDEIAKSVFLKKKQTMLLLIRIGLVIQKSS